MLPDKSALSYIDCPAKEYLVGTALYVLREIETGEPIPEDIAQKRAEAWAMIAANNGLS